MASRLQLARLGTSACKPCAVRPIASSSRFYSAEKPTVVKSDPKQTALNLIDILPGNNYVSKTGFITAGVGIASFLVSKEIFIFEAEAIPASCFIGLVGTLIYAFRKPMTDAANERDEQIYNILADARTRHRNIVQDRINEVNQMSDIVDVTKNLFEMSKDMANLEAKHFELQQKAALTHEVKAVLDSWVRHETLVRQREQSDIAKSVIDNVRKSLTDPKVQDQLLQQALADVDRLVASK